VDGVDHGLDRRLLVVPRAALAVALVALLVPATALAKGRVYIVDTIPSGKASAVTFTVHRAASFRVVLRVPTQGRAKLFLTGKTAPRGGPLIDTRTSACEGAAGSFYCRAAYEPLPKGTYTWRVAWSGARAARFELTVRW
jgi:hypothetical protein